MSEESYYKIIPESEVEPQKLQKTKKIIERFRNHVKETTGRDLSEFQRKDLLI